MPEGGIELLHVSMPRELKSRPSTSPTHPGRMLAVIILVTSTKWQAGKPLESCGVEVGLPRVTSCGWAAQFGDCAPANIFYTRWRPACAAAGVVGAGPGSRLRWD